jgi:hypothetical protein
VVFSVAMRKLRRHRNADAAAHGDAVDQRDDRLGVREQQMVELILGVEEFARGLAVALARLRQHADVAAGAEAARAGGVVDQDRAHARILTPRQERLDHVAAHVRRQRMQRLGAVQADAREAGGDGGEDFRHTRIPVQTGSSFRTRKARSGTQGQMTKRRLLGSGFSASLSPGMTSRGCDNSEQAITASSE